MIAKLRAFFHLTVATLLGLGGASAAVLPGREPPADPPQKSRDAPPDIVLAEAKTVQATDSLDTFLKLYAGPPPKPVVVSPPPKVKKAVVKPVRHKVTKNVVKVPRTKTVVKHRAPVRHHGY